MTTFRDVLETKLAEDVHWMLQQSQEAGDPAVVTGQMIANTRYTRLLRLMADAWLTRLEDPASRLGM